MKYLQGLIFILIASNLILSAFLVYSDYNGSTFCVTGKSCESVQNSEYGTLFGIKLSWLGLVAFIILLTLAILSYKQKIPYKYYLTISSIGAAFSIYFLLVQFFILKQICSTCLVIDSATIIIFILSIFNRN